MRKSLADLDALISGLLSDPAYATGRRRYPRTVTVDDAADLAEVAYAEVDRGTAAREASAKTDGITIACSAGCHYCCAEMILVYQPEAQAIARWMRLPENTEVRERFMAAYPAWRDAVGDMRQKLPDLVATGDSPGYLAAHVAQYNRRIICALNHEGLCTIYPIRPATCRNGHATDTNERCKPNSGLPAPFRLAFVPLDQFMRRANRLEKAAHHALGGPRERPEPLCDALYRLLGGTP